MKVRKEYDNFQAKKRYLELRDKISPSAEVRNKEEFGHFLDLAVVSLLAPSSKRTKSHYPKVKTRIDAYVALGLPLSPTPQDDLLVSLLQQEDHSTWTLLASYNEAYNWKDLASKLGEMADQIHEDMRDPRSDLFADSDSFQ